MTPREQFVASARSMLGVKWRHQGRQPWAVDCLGLIVLAMRAAGREVEDREGYPRNPVREGLRDELVRQCGAPGEWVHGGIALMQWPGTELPSHVGVLASDGDEWRLIHSFSGGNACAVEHRVDAHWRATIKEVFDPWRS